MNKEKNRQCRFFTETIHFSLLLFTFLLIFLKLISESCSALSASSLENLSAVSGSHSLSEAVFFLSVDLFRLICSEHSECTS